MAVNDALASSQAERSSASVFRADPAILLTLFVFSICLTVWVPFSIDLAGLNLRASQLLLPFVLGALLFSRHSWRVSFSSAVSLAAGLAWWIALAAWTVASDAVLGH